MNQSKSFKPTLFDPAPGVHRLRHFIVNSYILSEPGSASWVLVDAGIFRFSLAKILREASRQFGPDRPPAAVILILRQIGTARGNPSAD